MLNRRLFLSSLAVAGLAAKDRVPIRNARITKLFKSPEGHPNALEATPEGLWVGDRKSVV